MFINNCIIFDRDTEEKYLALDFKLYPIKTNDDEHIVDLLSLKTIELDKKTLHKHKISMGTNEICDGLLDNTDNMTVVPCDVREFKDHLIDVNGVLYVVTGNTTKIIRDMKCIDNLSCDMDVHIVDDEELVDNYGVKKTMTNMQNFLQDIDGESVYVSCDDKSDELKICDYVLTTDFDRICDDGYVVIPYFIQYSYLKKYKYRFIDMVVYFLSRTSVEKIIMDCISNMHMKPDTRYVRDKVLFSGNNKYQIDLSHTHHTTKWSGKKIAVTMYVDDIQQIEYFYQKMIECKNKYKIKFDVFITMPSEKTDCIKEITSGDIYDILNLLFVRCDLNMKFFRVENSSGEMIPFLKLCEWISFNLPDKYSYIVKLDTCYNMINRDDEIDHIFSYFTGGIPNKQKLVTPYQDYDFCSHICLCRLLNLMNIEKYPEQKMIFSRDHYEKIRENKNSEKNRFHYFAIQYREILKYRLWNLLKNKEICKYDSDIDDVSKELYQSYNVAFRQLIRILHSSQT